MEMIKKVMVQLEITYNPSKKYLEKNLKSSTSDTSIENT